MALKQQLTFDEAIRVAFAHYCLGVEQQTLAAMYGVNQGRVNEACKAIKRAVSEQRKPRDAGESGEG
jgi:hypothetical protein